MNAWARRCCSECGTVVHDGTDRIVSGDLILGRMLRDATWKGQLVHFTRREYEILELLVQRQGRVVQDWAFFIDIIDEEVSDKIIDVYICKIRTKLLKIDPTFDRLRRVWGEGLIWLEPGAPAPANAQDMPNPRRRRYRA